MRIKREEPEIGGDLTPMIDMTFQLIAFFMVLVNFTEADQNERIKLPSSELAKPPEGKLEDPLFLQLDEHGKVLYSGQDIPLASMKPILMREAEMIRRKNKPLSEATVIIRAHSDAMTGDVQKLIQLCQEAQFERFALRAKEKVSH